jgi:microcompartment protein CcmL/EutN
LNIESLGVIETKSFSGYLKVMDLFSKLTDIKVFNKYFLGEGIVSILIQGELGAIKRALDSGEKILSDSNCFIRSHTIPMPHKDLLQVINQEL